MSSDSDDCYGNVAQRLQNLKNLYPEQKAFDSPVSPAAESSVKSNSNTVKKDANGTNVRVNSSDEEYGPDEPVRITKAKRRCLKRKTKDTLEPCSLGTSRRRRISNIVSSSTVTNELTIALNDSPAVTPNATRGRGRNSRRGTTALGRGNTPQRGRGTTPRRHGRGKRSRAGRYAYQRGSISRSGYPIYSVGNTDEYEDLCDNQQLFSLNTQSNEVELVEDEDPLATDNEELSVKVYWQSLEVVRFSLRRYQKLVSIFNYFSKREDVDMEKLLFMYNDRILKVDDSPDSIDYSIAKFIDGGIVDQGVTGLVKQNSKEFKDGLRIKFQCQNLKKPFVTTVKAEERLGLAMMKCAEHLETPMDRLKFFFDGDIVSSKSTPQDLELDGDDCIDVKIS